MSSLETFKFRFIARDVFTGRKLFPANKESAEMLNVAARNELFPRFTQPFSFWMLIVPPRASKSASTSVMLAPALVREINPPF